MSNSDHPKTDRTDNLYTSDKTYKPTEEEKMTLCQAFKLLDVGGTGVIRKTELENLLISLGRLPLGKELDDVMSYANVKGYEDNVGMDYQGFEHYITKQLYGTSDEDELRNAFRAFDKSSNGKINVAELRHYLKNKEIKLTDDEIDFLFKKEDYWMLEEKNMFQYEHLIDKLLGKPTCDSRFLNC